MFVTGIIRNGIAQLCSYNLDKDKLNSSPLELLWMH